MKISPNSVLPCALFACQALAAVAPLSRRADGECADYEGPDSIPSSGLGEWCNCTSTGASVALGKVQDMLDSMLSDANESKSVTIPEGGKMVACNEGATIFAAPSDGQASGKVSNLYIANAVQMLVDKPACVDTDAKPDTVEGTVYQQETVGNYHYYVSDQDEDGKDLEGTCKEAYPTYP